MPVHPRSRGEHLNAASASRSTDGSSPLTRGTRCFGRRVGVSGRFIPAHAGNTWITLSVRADAAVHPRSRGEHGLEGFDALVVGRFIPAHAGNTPACPPSLSYVSGSSPLTRGTLGRCSAGDVTGRFIPAHAGNTRPQTPGWPPRPVHPRSRGEHARVMGGISNSVGSSPLTRGTRRGHRPQLGPVLVHPRSRGEHSWWGDTVAAATGSSPLTRGTPAQERRLRPLRRFIPAHAGNTLPLTR